MRPRSFRRWKTCGVTPTRGRIWSFSAAAKTLRGPQASGLILGKRRYIEERRRFGAPMHGACRSAKATKESMIGLYVAVKNFMATDWTVWNAKMDERVERRALRDAGRIRFLRRGGWIMVRWDRVTLAHSRMSRSRAPRKTSFIVCANSIFLSAWSTLAERDLSQPAEFDG